MTDDGKEKKLNIDFEPFKPVNTSLYLCDNKFHTEALNELLESDNKYGFIVMDGNGTLFGTLCGNTREVGRAVMHTCSSWGGVEGRLVLSAFVFFFSLSLSLSSFQVLHKFTVDLPKKHGRGGQSALRFARLRLEKRHNYVRKTAELSVQQFITNDRPNVAGLILAGSADFKNELANSDIFDPRLTVYIRAWWRDWSSILVILFPCPPLPLPAIERAL